MLFRSVEFDFENRHRGLKLIKMPRRAVDGLGNKLEHQVQVYFIFLRCHQRCLDTHEIIEFSNPVTVGVVERLEFDDIWVAHDPHDLKLSVLRGSQQSENVMWRKMSNFAYLEALVLEDSLDSRVFARRRQLGLKDNAKGPVAHYLTLGVSHLLRLPRQAILNLLVDGF